MPKATGITSVRAHMRWSQVTSVLVMPAAKGVTWCKNWCLFFPMIPEGMMEKKHKKMMQGHFGKWNPCRCGHFIFRNAHRILWVVSIPPTTLRISLEVFTLWEATFRLILSEYKTFCKTCEKMPRRCFRLKRFRLLKIVWGGTGTYLCWHRRWGDIWCIVTWKCGRGCWGKGVRWWYYPHQGCEKFKGGRHS